MEKKEIQKTIQKITKRLEEHENRGLHFWKKFNPLLNNIPDTILCSPDLFRKLKYHLGKIEAEGYFKAYSLTFISSELLPSEVGFFPVNTSNTFSTWGI